MPDPGDPHAETRETLRAELRERLSDLGEPLRLLAEDLLGDEDRPIDWVAALADGRVVVGLLEPGEASADLLCEGLAQRAWVEARLGDWQKLAPGLGIHARERPVLLLVAQGFPPRIRKAAREADPESLWLACHARSGVPGALGLRPLAVPPPARPAAPSREAGRPALRSVFRTGLEEEDLRPARREALPG